MMSVSSLASYGMQCTLPSPRLIQPAHCDTMRICRRHSRRLCGLGAEHRQKVACARIRALHKIFVPCVNIPSFLVTVAEPYRDTAVAYRYWLVLAIINVVIKHEEYFKEIKSI